MKSLLLAAFMLCHFNVVAQAQGSKTPPPNAIVVEETKTVEVAPKKKAPAAKSGKSSTSKKVTAGKSSFTTTTTTTTEVAAPGTTAYPQQNYTAPAVAAPAASPANGSAQQFPPSTTGSVAAVATPAPAAEAKSPWRLVYFGEYFGPRLSNINLNQTQGPEDVDPGYGSIDHSVKVGYQVHKNHVVGTQVRASTSFDPDKQMAMKNLRFYGTWANMIDTADVNLQTVVDVEIPTSDSARWAGNVLNLNLKFFWELKTQLRNWTFSAMTMLRPMFFNDPTTKTDLYLGLFPWIQMDFAPDWALIFEASFDASHSYQQTFFTFGSDDPDFIRAGVQYSFNSHFQINPAFQFFTGNFSFKAATLYMSLTAAL